MFTRTTNHGRRLSASHDYPLTRRCRIFVFCRQDLQKVKLERDALAQQVKELGGDSLAAAKGDTGTQSLQFYSKFVQAKAPAGSGEVFK